MGGRCLVFFIHYYGNLTEEFLRLILKTTVYWYVMLCSFVDMYQCFGGMLCTRLHDITSLMTTFLMEEGFFN
jgi:hypothetical protein